MAEGALVDRLDRTVDAILKRSDATAALKDPELAPLARVAADLRHYPGQHFKTQLRLRLERRTIMSSAIADTQLREGFTTITPYLRVSEPGLVEFLTRVFDAVDTGSARVATERIHHEVRIGNSMLVIDEGGSQTREPLKPAEFHVYVEDVDAVFQRALAAGATSLGEPADRPYGERSGFVKDAFGNHWFIARHLGGSYVPEGLRTVTPFVHAKDTSQYIEFLERAFGAVEEGRHEIGEGIVRYARVRIGSAAIELGAAERGVEAMPGAFYMHVRDVDDLFKQAIAAGAKALSSPAGQKYVDRAAIVEDPAGNQWFIVGAV